MAKRDVVVVGGGYAGLMAAARLRLAGLGVTLVDPRPAFRDRIRLHEQAARRRDADLPWRVVLPAGVRHLQGHAARVAGDGVAVTTSRGRLDLDAAAVLLTVGSASPSPWSGAWAIDDAEAIGARLASLPDPRVVVVGAGPTGLEVATELASAHRGARVGLVDAHGLPGLSARGAALVDRRLAALGVTRHVGRVLGVGRDAVVTGDGELPADLVIACTGFRVPDLARASGLPVDVAGRVIVDPDLSVPGHPGLFAAGDAAALPAHPWVGSGCAMALPLGAHAGRNAAAWLAGEAPRPLDLGWTLKQIALGPDHGLVQGLSADGRPTWSVAGRWVAFTKAALLWAVPRVARREVALGLPLYRWPGSPVTRALTEVA